MFRIVRRADLSRICNPAQITGHQDDIGRFDGYIRARPDGNADISRCQRRGVVDAVADESQRAELVPQGDDRIHLAVGQHFGGDVIDPQPDQPEPARCAHCLR